MKILIVKTSALGDIIHVFPSIAYLKGKFPHAQIDWVVEAPFADLVQSHPAINRAIRIKTRAWRQAIFKGASWQEIGECRRQIREEDYDVVFDLQGNIKSALITAQARSKHKVGFGRQTVPEWPNTLFTHHHYNPPSGHNIRDDYLYIVSSYFNEKPLPHANETVQLKISPEQHAKVEAILAALPGQRKVMVCPGSAWPNKQMTTEALVDFLKRLQPTQKCHFLVLWGSPQEKLMAETICETLAPHASVAEKLPLHVLQNLMGRMDLVIAMDSLPLHLAGTTSTPTFSVFGPSSAAKYGPEGLQHHAMQGTCPYGRTFDKRCSVLRTCPTGQCIRGLSGDDVFASFKEKQN